MTRGPDDRWIWSPWAHAMALFAVLTGEFALFGWATGRNFAWIYPRWFDQIQYLRNAYDAFEHAHADGFLGGRSAALGTPSAQGALHAVFTLVAFSLAGASRSAALGVNMAAFVLLQGVTFLAARRFSRSYALAWVSVGLLAALQVPWSDQPGSAADFRLDWIAACLYGVALGVAVLGNGFRSTRWAAALGLAVGLVLLTRFLTLVYFALIFAGFFAWLLTRQDRWRRCLRLALAGLVSAAVSGWAFWRARHLLHDYYWVGHVAGPERALRDSRLSIFSAISWLFSETLEYQVGIAAGLLALGAAAVYALQANGAALAEGRGGPNLIRNEAHGPPSCFSWEHRLGCSLCTPRNPPLRLRLWSCPRSGPWCLSFRSLPAGPAPRPGRG